MREIVTNIAKAEMVVILGTKTYGVDTGAAFSTFQELEFIVNERKPMFLVKMCDRFETAHARFYLGGNIAHHAWMPQTEAEQQNVPDDLVDAIIHKFESLPPRTDAATP